MKNLILLITLTTICLTSLSFTTSKVYIATAYCLKGKTAIGIPTRRGIVAADIRHHKLGTKIEIDAGKYSGIYLVADTGGKIKGRRLDIWMGSRKEAIKFGRRKVYVN